MGPSLSENLGSSVKPILSESFRLGFLLKPKGSYLGNLYRLRANVGIIVYLDP